MHRALLLERRGGGVSFSQADGYREKLTKYLPVVVTAFFLGAAALAANTQTLMAIALLVGVAATPAYLFVLSWTLEPARQPLLQFYVLSTLVFVVWAFGTNATLAGLFGLGVGTTQIALFVAVFLILLVDSVNHSHSKVRCRGKGEGLPWARKRTAWGS